MFGWVLNAPLGIKLDLFSQGVKVKSRKITFSTLTTDSNNLQEKLFDVFGNYVFLQHWKKISQIRVRQIVWSTSLRPSFTYFSLIQNETWLWYLHLANYKNQWKRKKILLCLLVVKWYRLYLSPYTIKYAYKIY